MNPDLVMLMAGIGIGASSMGLTIMAAVWYATKVPQR